MWDEVAKFVATGFPLTVNVGAVFDDFGLSEPGQTTSTSTDVPLTYGAGADTAVTLTLPSDEVAVDANVEEVDDGLAVVDELDPPAWEAPELEHDAATTPTTTATVTARAAREARTAPRRAGLSCRIMSPLGRTLRGTAAAR
jgi:hypothetical protein